MSARILISLVFLVQSEMTLAYEPDVTQRRSEDTVDVVDHLIPSGSRMPEELPRYYIATFGRYPSFDQVFEWQIVLKQRRYVLSTWRLERDKAKDTVRRVEVVDVEIPQQLAAVIYEMWANGILHSRYARLAPGLDGTTYSFSTYLNGVGWPSGTTWSPNQGPPKVLVDAGEEVLRFGRDRKGDSERLLVKLRTSNEYLNDYYAKGTKTAEKGALR